jgi:hypothetical protein
VLLPAPLGPIMPIISPLFTENETLFKILLFWYPADKSFTAITVSIRASFYHLQKLEVG